MTDNLHVQGNYIQLAASTAADPGYQAAGAFRYNSDSAITAPQYYTTTWESVSSQGFATAIAVALG